MLVVTPAIANLWLSAVIAVGSIWVGLTISYAAPKIPPSFAILAVVTGLYLLVHLVGRLPGRARRAARQAYSDP